MLRVGQVDAYAGLADYKLHVIIIELSGDVWGEKKKKEIQLIMQQLQKALTPRSLSQESFTTRKSLSWAQLPGEDLGGGTGTGVPPKRQLCGQGRSVRAGGRRGGSVSGHFTSRDLCYLSCCSPVLQQKHLWL